MLHIVTRQYDIIGTQYRCDVGEEMAGGQN